MEDSSKNININISTRAIMKFFVIAFLIFAAYKLMNIILILLTSIVLASFVEFSVLKLKKYIRNRTFAVFLIYIFTLATFICLFSVFVPIFLNEMSILVKSLGKYIPDSSILNTLQPDSITGAKAVVKTISKNASLGEVISSVQDMVNSFSGNFFDIFGQAFGGIFNFILIIIISFYLSIKEKGIENFLRIILPDDKEEYLINLWQRTEHKIGLWVRGQLLLGVIIGLLTYLGLTLLGVKYSFVLALLTAIFEIIPFGIYLAVIPATIFSYVDGGVTLALLTFMLYMVIHQFENYLIYPLIVQNVIGVSPLVVIISLLVGWELYGFWGVILAIPVSVCLFEFLDDLEKKKILARNN